MKSWALQPPFLVFPDQEGGFFVFHSPLATFEGPALGQAEAFAGDHSAWIAGGLEYARAEEPGPGWWGVFSSPLVLSLADLASWADPGPVVVGALSTTVARDEYDQAFHRVRSALQEGTTYQVNLTFQLKGRALSSAPWTWRSALRLWLDLIATQGREACFAALGTDPELILVSASPELFFRSEGVEIEARPMKGTAPRHTDPVQDAARREELATSPKTRAENLMITDMLRNDLGRLAEPGGVSVPSLFEVEEYPTVWQMTSTVRARLSTEQSLADLMRALFPCASITGAPKLSTQRIIEVAEARARGWYTGTLGWYRPSGPEGPSRSRFSVLIRTLVFDQEPGAFSLGVGGGVVWDSTAEGEWQEAWAKTRFLTSVQRDFSLTEAVLWTSEGPSLLAEHEARLTRACRDFGGDLVPGTLERSLTETAQSLRDRGLSGPLKLRAWVDPSFILRSEGEPLSAIPEVLTVALAAQAFDDNNLLFRRYKTTRRDIYEQSKVPGVDQTLHYNLRGELTESTSMNLVIEIGGRFLTPAASCGLLPGTLRARLLAEGVIEEAILPVDVLDRADGIWLINSVRGWKRARWIVLEKEKGSPLQATRPVSSPPRNGDGPS